MNPRTVWINYTEPNPDPKKPPVRTLREVVPTGELRFTRPDGSGTGQAGAEWCLVARDPVSGAEVCFALTRIERWSVRPATPALESVTTPEDEP
jgi:hypothetical protein